MKRTVPIVLAFALLGLANAAPAQQQVTIYRCTDARGALLLQNDEPCPAGYRQQTQVIDVPPALPSYIPREQRMPDVVAPMSKIGYAPAETTPEQYAEIKRTESAMWAKLIKDANIRPE